MGNAYKSVLASGGTPTLQSKSVIATTSQQTVSPDSGYDGLSSVTVDPQVHDQYYTPTAMNDSGSGNDMGASHNYRYVTTTGMYKPTTVKDNTSTSYYTSNGVKTITGLENYTGIKFTVQVSASLSETTLWTNPSPTADFGSQTITLNQSISGFTYLKMTVKATKSASDSKDFIISVSDFKAMNNSGTANTFNGWAVGEALIGSAHMVRRAIYVSDTSIMFSSANAMYAQTKNDTSIIPTKISGLK